MSDESLTLETITALADKITAIPKPPRFFVGPGTDVRIVKSRLKLGDATEESKILRGFEIPGFPLQIDRYLPANFMRIQDGEENQLWDMRPEQPECVFDSRVNNA